MCTRVLQRGALNFALNRSEPGERALSKLIESLQNNITLLKINWRLTSRQSFALNKCLTRNNEIVRRLGAGKNINNF